MIRILSFSFLLMIELQAKFFFKISQSGLGIVGVADQGLPIFDLLAVGGTKKVLFPLAKNTIQFLYLSLILKMEGMVIVIILGSLNKLLEGFGAVFR